MKTLKTCGLLLLLAIGLFSCAEDVNPDLPACIQDIIDESGRSETSNKPSKVVKYTWNDEVVYYVPAFCCDVFSDLYDSECNLICHPDGGISGRGDGNCENFFNEAEGGEVLWDAEE